MRSPGKLKTHFFALLLSCWFLLYTQTAFAHPHIFIHYQMEIPVYNTTMQGIKMHWSLDLMNSQLILDEFDQNHDQRITGQEAVVVAENMRSNLKSFEYFTQVSINGHRIPIRTVKDIKVSYANKQITYTLYLPCPIPITAEAKRMTVTPIDSTNYVAFIPDSRTPIKIKSSANTSIRVTAAPKKMYDSTHFLMVRR